MSSPFTGLEDGRLAGLDNSDLLGSQIVELIDEAIDLAVGDGDITFDTAKGLGILLVLQLLVDFQEGTIFKKGQDFCV